MLKKITIEHIKGIRRKVFDLDVLPNKPSLLVAPNGYGKSSLATAFNSMNRNRIVLQEDDFYLESSANTPSIEVEYQKPNGSIVNLSATSTTNTINRELDYFVINNLTRPKGNASTFSGFANARASLIIEDVVLVDRIPNNVSFNYSFRDAQTKFGTNSRVLPNSNTVFANRKLVERLRVRK